MRIGINEVIISHRSCGTRQRDINVLRESLRQISADGHSSIVYVAREMDEETLTNLVGQSPACDIVKTPLSSVSTYRRVVAGMVYWRHRTSLDRLDVFHSNYFPLPSLCVPTVLTVNDVRFVHFPDTYPASRRLFLRVTVPLSLRRATRIIAISQDTKRDLINHFSVPPDKIDVVYVAADPRFSRVTDDALLKGIRERYCLPERFILCVGHLEPRKNLRRLVEAYHLLEQRRNVPHSLVILGKPSFGYEPVTRFVEEKSLGGRVIFTGYVDDGDMPGIYTLADLFVFPSLHEGFGVPLLEAMACGTPVVASNVSALPEVGADAAQYIIPRDVDSIVEGMAAVLSSADLRQRLVERGYQRVREFSAKDSARSLLEVYHSTQLQRHHR